MTPEERFLLDGDGNLRALRKRFRLDEFLTKFPTATGEYFGMIDELREAYLIRKTELTDPELRDCVVIALRRDGSFMVYLEKDRAAPSEYLLDGAKWREVLLAGAGTILCHYEESHQ